MMRRHVLPSLGVLLSMILLLGGCSARMALFGAQRDEPSAQPEQSAEPAVFARLTTLEAFVASCLYAYGEIPDEGERGDGEKMLEFLRFFLPLDGGGTWDAQGQDSVSIPMDELDALWTASTGTGLPDLADVQGEDGSIENGMLHVRYAPPDLVPAVRYQGDVLTVSMSARPDLSVHTDGQSIRPDAEPQVVDEDPYQDMDADGFIRPKVAYIEEINCHSSLYYGEKAVDGVRHTAWVSAQGTAQGAWIKLHFEKPVPLSDVLLINGNMRDEDAFRRSGRVMALELRFSEGSYLRFEGLEDGYGAHWSGEFDPVVTDWVELRVLDVFPGEIYEDVAIAELEFFYNDNPSAPEGAGVSIDEPNGRN